jgi:hypothetical protein
VLLSTAGSEDSIEKNQAPMYEQPNLHFAGERRLLLDDVSGLFFRVCRSGKVDRFDGRIWCWKGKFFLTCLRSSF